MVSLLFASMTASADVRPASTLDVAIAAIEGDRTTPEEALRLVRDSAARFGTRSAHRVAVASNTRAFRLERSGRTGDALPLYLEAIRVDASYAFPRYNAARVFVARGDHRSAVHHLRALGALGGKSRQRLEATRTDPAFKALQSDAAYLELFRAKPPARPEPNANANAIGC